MARRKIIKVNNNNCSGCMLCVLSCSFINAGLFDPKKSYIKLNKNDKKQRFRLTFSAECKACGACIKACAFDALKWNHENTVN